MSTTQPEGYLAIPTAANGKAVLVLHAWWGLNSTIKALCDRLADAGFAAFAPDLYHGKVTDQISEAEVLVGSMDEKVDQTRAHLAEAVAFLKERASVDTLAVIGFSMGAYYALDLSVNEADSIRSVVVFYGTGPADFSRSQASYMAHYADSDEYEPQENIDYLENALKTAGCPATIHIYNGTGHWFFEPDVQQAYNEPAATLAWERTLEFLNR